MATLKTRSKLSHNLHANLLKARPYFFEVLCLLSRAATTATASRHYLPVADREHVFEALEALLCLDRAKEALEGDPCFP